ncbi:hypothetical protein HNP38_002040 [Chryseobacterium defluvii]|uniref:Uncharacterized protein n=1 Tax=Chryseobacterium defluvii TaxID=160396 RepID=A0A840KGB4_9FLAO|nr:hypothetical protein [Chryseobacterium defluvii]
MGFIPEEQQAEMVERLRKDLLSGKWDEKYGDYRTKETFTCALRLIVSSI